LKSDKVTIIGVDGVGRHLALLLAARGVTSIQFIDESLVKRQHVATQGFLADDVGRPKVHAVADICQEVNPLLSTEEIQACYHRGMQLEQIVFCCLREQRIRERIRLALREKCQFWGEAFLADDSIRVATVSGRQVRQLSSLSINQVSRFASSDPRTLPAAAIAASLVLLQFEQFLAGKPFAAETRFDLLRCKIVRKGIP
jgi:hypothetical protein